MIFDALDTVQGYKGAPIGGSKGFNQAYVAQQLGMSQEQMLSEVPYEAQLWMAGEGIIRGDLEPVLLEGAKEIIELVKQEGITPVIVTADVPYCAALATKPLTDRGLIELKHVYGMNALGSKKEATTWEKVRATHFPTNAIAGIFEDSEPNLKAALNAYTSERKFSSGYLVKQADWIVTEHRKHLVQGNLPSLTEVFRLQMASDL